MKYIQYSKFSVLQFRFIGLLLLTRPSSRNFNTGEHFNSSQLCQARSTVPLITEGALEAPNALSRETQLESDKATFDLHSFFTKVLACLTRCMAFKSTVYPNNNLKGVLLLKCKILVVNTATFVSLSSRTQP